MKPSILCRCTRCGSRAEYQAETNNPVEHLRLCGECLSDLMVKNEVDHWAHLEAREWGIRAGWLLVGLALAGLAGWLFVFRFFFLRCTNG